MPDFHPSSRMVPRAIVLQVVEGGEVDVHHATLIWDAILPSGKVLQQHSSVDEILDVEGDEPSVNRQNVRKLLCEGVARVQAQEGF